MRGLVIEKAGTKAPAAASAGVIASGVALTMCSLPSPRRVVASVVANIAFTAAAGPRTCRLRDWMVTARPCWASSAATACLEASVAPKRAANCAGVSHLW